MVTAKLAPIDARLLALLRRCESLPDSLDRRQALLDEMKSLGSSIDGAYAAFDKSPKCPADRRLLRETQASVQAQIEQFRQQADDVMTECWDLHSAASAFLEAAARLDSTMLPVWERFCRLPTPGNRNPMRQVLQLQALLQSALQAVAPASQSPEPEAPSSARGADDLLTAQEVAAKLGISDKTVYRHAKEGRIPYVRIQSSLRFRPSEIEAWLASKSFQPASLKKAPPAGTVTTRNSSRR